MAVATSRLDHTADIEDVVQEAAIRLMQQRTLPDDERGLAYTMASHAASEWGQRGRRQKRDSRKCEPLDPDNSAHHGQAPSAEREAMGRIELEEAGSSAPDPVKLAAQGYTLLEISQLTGIHPQTIYSWIVRWRKANRREP